MAITKQEFLLDAIRISSSSDSLDTILLDLSKLLVKSTGCSFLGLFTFEDNWNSLEMQCTLFDGKWLTRQETFSQVPLSFFRLAQKLTTEKKSILVDEENLSILGVKTGDDVTNVKLASGLILPLLIRSCVCGALVLGETVCRRDFGSVDQELVEGIAELASLALERRKLYLEAAEKREHVRRLEEFDQFKNEFISIAGHEFRTPLTIIKGVTDFLLRNEDGNLPAEKRRHLLEEVGGEAMRLNELVGDVLEVSRIESGKVALRIEPVDIATIMTEVVELWNAEAATRNINLSLGLEQHPIVLADARRTQQILINLLSNAIKYSPDGTSVQLGVRIEEQSAFIHISDQGVGIFPDQIPYLFDKFNRLSNPRKNEVKGTGLGLYITKGLVEAQGGTIRVESSPGLGSKFTFTLPLA